MNTRLQRFLRDLRETPDPALVAFVEGLEVGRYSASDLWRRFNGATGYMNDAKVFHYALRQAGMEQDDRTGWVRR